MEKKFFNVGYTTYLQKSETKKANWTSKIIKKISEHKIIFSMCIIISMCIMMNFWLIYKFVKILEMSKVF